MLHKNLGINEKGHLTFAGTDTVSLAQKHGTPLCLIDYDSVREMMRIYADSMEKYMGKGSGPLYASKALSFKGIYRVCAEEGIGIDVVSSGELYTAAEAGFPLERAYFHGNNKTDYDIAFAMSRGIGYFVVDNIEELEAVNAEAKRRGITQNILLRLTPGIDPHTHAKISTGNIDSKFGSAIATGAAESITLAALECESLKLCGFHCHVGSQIFDTQPFDDAAVIMLNFIALMKKKHGFETVELNLGGGFGVRYTEDDPEIDYEENIKRIASLIDQTCASLDIVKPIVHMEPGRSIVAAAGMTLYTVGSVKEIEGFKNYVSVDGGMTDNPRYALYESKYTVINAHRAGQAADFCATIAGRCCESGDLIAEGAYLARPVRGENVAVLPTGAYNYSMASNYNRIPRPAVVALEQGSDRVAVRRESFEDLILNDCD